MLKSKSVDSFTPAFTAINDRASPPTPRGAIRVIGMSDRQNSPQHHTQQSSENDYGAANTVDSSDSSTAESSPTSPKRRKRSRSAEAQEKNADSTKAMEAPQHRPLPPIDRTGEQARRWTAEPQPHHGYQDMRQPRTMDTIHGSMPPLSAPHMPTAELNGSDHPSSTDPNRPGVQTVDPKKRKRQFANRTKTGCGTCRRRKKKCDEAKPECMSMTPKTIVLSNRLTNAISGNNCSRGGFECEGYASKVPWPKNGATKLQPPLQAKEQSAHDLAAPYPRCPVCNQMHIPHCEPTRINGQAYADPRAHPGAEGARARPIVVEEQDRKPPAPSKWTNGWSEPPRVSYAEHAAPVPAQYSQPPAPNPDRTPSHEHHMQQPQGPPPPPRQHNPRIYHHTPQSMSQATNHTPAVAESHRQAPPPQPRQPSMVAPTSAPPAPPQPQPHYAPQPRALKTEKEKMLSGEPFLVNDEELMNERAQCRGVVFGFNNTASPSVVIARGERERNFKRIIAASWIPPPPRHLGRPSAHASGHLGGNVNVDTPFHCHYGYNISIGENVNIGSDCRLLDSARIAIGRNTRIGDAVTIQTLKTPTDAKSLKGSNGTEIAREVLIGENVYIGDNVTVEAGVRIGNNAIIRSGSVVVRVSTL